MQAIASIFIAAAILLACGGDGNDGADAAAPGQACDPFANTGCDEGEKCSLAVEATDPEVRSRTACVPAGGLPLDAACTTAFDNAGPLAQGMGFDECVGGTFCLRDRCTEICRLDTDPQSPVDSCPDGVEACGLYVDIFEEFGSEGDGTVQGYGLCEPTCDVFDPAGCGAGEACYLSLTTGAATCSSNEVKKQLGEECAGLNACDLGMGCIFQTSARDPTSCTAYCDTATGLTAAGQTCAAALGGQAGDPLCVQINRFYTGVSLVGDGFGMCVDCAIEAISAREGCQARSAGQISSSAARPPRAAEIRAPVR